MEFIQKCRLLISAYENGEMGDSTMPEESHPETFKSNEDRLVYFTLPMALNYQRDSYSLWKSAHKTYQDKQAQDVFSVGAVSSMSDEELKEKLLKYKLALQPNKHILTWKTISQTVYQNWGSFENFFKHFDHDFLKIKEAVQTTHKKGFPYLSGPKIFNYWSFIIQEYGGITLKNSEYIDIAPDTHITRCSVILGVISQEEAAKLSKEEISRRWLGALQGSGINPISMHPPLWFWSHNNFIYKLPD